VNAYFWRSRVKSLTFVRKTDQKRKAAPEIDPDAAKILFCDFNPANRLGLSVFLLRLKIL